ncbi:MAG TPA: alginate export family protein, partial [Cyclobacteriaceae bacterium]|nr:alginate export family protein [Cyclobacteriaceae bacterium]
IWGQQDPRLTSPANIQVFEAWAEPYFTPNFSVRLGRQVLSYDNQRIFSVNNWRTGGQSHDAVNFRFNSRRLVSEFAAAFNQLSDRTFGTDFRPSGFTNYKFLAVNYLRCNIGNCVTLTAINAADGYQNSQDAKSLDMRFTDGGRIEIEKGKYYLTFSGYYQSGKNPAGAKLLAWYLQPEARYTSPFNLKIRLGTEVFSGDRPGSPGVADHSFVPLYGTNHQFNGFLDLITNFPDHTGRAGLINPYFSFTQSLGKKLEIRTDFLTFYSKEQIVQNDVRLEKYLGFENDWLVGYKPGNFTKADIGMSWALITESLATIRNSGTGAADHNPTFIYIILAFTPQLFSTTYK